MVQTEEQKTWNIYCAYNIGHNQSGAEKIIGESMQVLFDASFSFDTFLARDWGLITYLLQFVLSEVKLCSLSCICLLAFILVMHFHLHRTESG